MISVQVIGPVLVAIGLLVRSVAPLVLVLTLQTQFSGAAQDERLFWAAWFGWYVMRSRFAVARPPAEQGMKHSPLPLAALAIAAGDWVTVRSARSMCS
jgi:hypothetical protein